MQVTEKPKVWHQYLEEACQINNRRLCLARKLEDFEERTKDLIAGYNEVMSINVVGVDVDVSRQLIKDLLQNELKRLETLLINIGVAI